MNLKLRELNLAMGRALMVGSVAAVSMPVLAQDADKETRIETVTVTGSRVKRVDAETSQPVFTMSREDIKAQGLTSVGDVIQNITANGSTLNSTFNNGGNGETRVSLRNLGSNRTLVLINGRRWVGGTGLGGAVDLNTIPTAAVDRIEVLKDGASSIYGSDAIAGVVNVILRTDFTGAEFNTYQGEYDEGDGQRESYDMTIGASGDRYTALMGAGYVKEQPVGAGDRTISAEPTFGTGTTFGSSTTPFGRFQICNTATPVTAPLSCPGANRVLPNGSSGQFTYAPGQSGTNWRPFVIPDDIYNFAPDNYLLTPQERSSIFGRASVELTDDISFSMMASYNERKSEQLLAAMPIVLGTGPGAGLQARTVLIHQNNIYNPFGAPVVRIQRRAVETGGRSFKQDVDTFAFNGTLEGSFSLGDRYFSWDAGYMYAKNDQNDVTEGLFDVSALRQALGPSMLVNGVPTCVSTPGNAATAIAGCVPLNLLGAPGTITPDMLAFSSFIAHDQLGYEMLDYFANLYGEIFELPGGMAGFAFGLEHRTEEGFDTPDALIAAGNTTGNARKPTDGRYSLDEAYLEFALPVLSDVTMAKSLEFSLATRYSDYSNFGDTTNSSFGMKWNPIDDLLIRASYAEGFRAPSIAELFQGVSDNFPQVADPCNTVRFGSLSADAQARCIAQGVPAGGYQQGNPQIRTLVGGNPNLSPETSVSKNFGIVYSPSFLNGFDVSVDWWKIRLRNTISGAGAQFILDDCILNNNQAFCSQFNRLPGGDIDNLLEGNGNIGTSEVEGFDVTFNYVLADTDYGTFSFSLDNSYTLKNRSDNDLDGELDDSVVGEYQDRNNNWRLRSNLATRWEMGNWGATWNSRYYSRQEEDCQFMVDYGFGDLCSDPNRVDADGNPAALNKLGGTTYHDISGYWNAPWDARITVGINNVGEKDPPVSFTTFANSFDPQYEVPGRFYYMQYTQRF
ncbi:MAG: TonB-dependent receptor [Xanthomonadales bacterium]|nr:Vitamin B12 transporter BtuB [Xanthomonadales bacterium]MCC6593194.1 TonB-dependent receptor [Xanthomonadales bacterium]MCE7930706.1 TonB-dependent receptor [Xanthomonadales bacterium PRO6]